MIIREYNSSDCKSIINLFYKTVHTVNAKDYSKEQLDVWATGQEKIAEWNKCFLNSYTVVVETDGRIIGFGNIYGNGYLDKLYVDCNYQHCGVATAICNKLERYGNIDSVEVHASVTAKTFLKNADTL